MKFYNSIMLRGILQFDLIHRSSSTLGDVDGDNLNLLPLGGVF